MLARGRLLQQPAPFTLWRDEMITYSAAIWTDDDGYLTTESIEAATDDEALSLAHQAAVDLLSAGGDYPDEGAIVTGHVTAARCYDYRRSAR